jgi:diaminopimelate decarboxylase
MHYFHYLAGELYCEEIPISQLSQEVGTPFYLYSYKTLQRHYRAFDQAFQRVPHLICFAMKSNSNLAILRIFIKEGAGMDVVSGGELYRALKAGVDPKKIVYAGVGKSQAEIKYALEAGILMFNVESSQELEAIDAIAGQMRLMAPVALRVNPDVDPQTHPYISTGLKKNKFGIDISKALDHYILAREAKNLQIVGIHTHIGSQITETGPFVEAVKRLSYLLKDLQGAGIGIKYLDLGGGLGITYKDEEPPHPQTLAEALVPYIASLDCKIIFEPGRVIVGNAGVLITKVLYTKSTTEKNFVIVDAGMNDLIRPSLYGSYQHIQPVVLKDEQVSLNQVDVVGPICESGDFLGKDRILPSCQAGDLLAVMSAGAYGFSMSSNYNARPKVAEILVKDDQYYIIRQRETYEDLIRGETIPPFLR